MHGSNPQQPPPGQVKVVWLILLNQFSPMRMQTSRQAYDNLATQADYRKWIQTQPATPFELCMCLLVSGALERRNCLLVAFLTSRPETVSGLPPSIYDHTPGSLFLTDSTTTILVEVMTCYHEPFIVSYHFSFECWLCSHQDHSLCFGCHHYLIFMLISQLFSWFLEGKISVWDGCAPPPPHPTPLHLITVFFLLFLLISCFNWNWNLLFVFLLRSVTAAPLCTPCRVSWATFVLLSMAWWPWADCLSFWNVRARVCAWPCRLSDVSQTGWERLLSFRAGTTCRVQRLLLSWKVSVSLLVLSVCLFDLMLFQWELRLRLKWIL